MIKKKFTSVNRSHGLRVNVGPQQRKRRASPEVRAKHLQAQKDFKLRHPDRVRANNKAWYAKNTEYAKQTALQRYMADPGAAKIRHTKWLASKQEKLAGRKKPKCCEVCKASHQKIHFDHDHKTGKFRGRLCHSCNISIGLLRESPKTLRKLVAYLESHKEKRMNAQR